MNQQLKRGITLLEMALVLLVIAIIVASIVSGRSIADQARTRSALNEIDRIVKAMTAFKDKYGQLPGDFNRAGELWGLDAYCPNHVGGAPQRATCNGNGNGQVMLNSELSEGYHFWQHLTNAGMWEGFYAGVVAGGGMSYALYTARAIPASSIPGAAYNVLYEYNNAITAEMFILPPGHWIEMGGQQAACATAAWSAFNCITQSGAFPPARAVSIDVKMDDGFPGMGTVKGRPSTSTLNPGCTTTAVASTSRYDADNIGNVCSLTISTGM